MPGIPLQHPVDPGMIECGQGSGDPAGHIAEAATGSGLEVTVAMERPARQEADDAGEQRRR